VRRFALLLALLPLAAAAQYAGPALETCRAYAEADVRKAGNAAALVQFDRDAQLNIERYTRKVGSQFVSSLLHGNGAIVLPAGVPVEMSFVCLLAEEKRAVFFHWMPRRDAPVLAQCRRAKDAATCLDALLAVAEQDLTQLYARHFLDARQADAGSGAENATGAFRRSADAFRAYRDSECARRGAAGSEPHKACMVELTRRRGLDLR
jgi:hypothetical protein